MKFLYIILIVFLVLFFSRYKRLEKSVDLKTPVVNKSLVLEEKNEEIEINKISTSTNYEGETFRVITAYNAGDINQCDGDPCISANGENVCELLEFDEKVCAANFVPFGTILDIEGYGKCRVIDRTSSKYKNRVDIAMKLNEKDKALEFGKRVLRVIIIK